MSSGAQQIGGRAVDTDMETWYVVREDRVYIDMRPVSPECTALGRIAYQRGYPPLPCHRHPGTAEVIFWKSGTQPMRVGRTSLLLRGGDALIVPPGAEHGTDGAPSYPGARYWLHVALPESGAAKWLGLSAEERAPLVRFLSDRCHRVLRCDAGMTGRLDAILRCFKSPDDVFRLPASDRARMRTDLLATLFDLQGQVVACDRTAAGNAAADSRRRIIDCCVDIDDSGLKIPPVDALAAACGVTKARLSRVFLELTGITPHIFFQRRHVSKAERLLLFGADDVSAVAGICGFKTPQHFAKVFKKVTGVTPGRYAEHVAGTAAGAADRQT